MLEFSTLKKTYKDFQLPAAELTVEGKKLKDNKAGLYVAAAEADLTCGYEASQVHIRIAGCTDAKSGKFKTKDLEPFILIGSFLSLKMGYVSQMKEIFRGFISGCEFVNEDGEPFVELTAMDVKGMMMANCYARQLQASYYSDAVKEILDKPVYQNLLSKGIIDSMNIRPTPDKSRGEPRGAAWSMEMVSESDYEFIIKAARKYAFEFYTDVGVVRFRKGKEQKETYIKLGPSAGLTFFRIGYDIRGLVQKMEIRNMEDEKGKLISAAVKFQNKISMGSKAKSMISQTQKIYIDADMRSKEDAKDRLQHLFDKMSYSFGSLECECVGIPELLPGHFMETVDLGQPADNCFYIEKVCHMIDQRQGYRCRITGCADGL